MHYKLTNALRRCVLIGTVSALTLVTTASVSAQNSAAPHDLPLHSCQLPLGQHGVGGNLDAQCGTLTVPVDRTNPTNGQTVALAVEVLPALDSTAHGLPIFHLEGGPGASAITQFGNTWYSSYALFRQKHPIVLIDQRGMGRSGVLSCITPTKPSSSDLVSFAVDAPIMPIRADALSDCQARLSKTTDTRFYTSDKLADDTDAVRVALGYDQILLFGNSYGTDLAQFYLRQYGAHTAGVVLDSAVGPAQFFTLDAATSGQAAFDRVIALCDTDPVCGMTYPDLAGTFRQVLATLQKHSVTLATSTNPTRVTLTSTRLLSLIFDLLYSSSNETVIPYLLKQAALGNYIPIISLLQQSTASGAIAEGAYLSIVCAEQVAAYTPTVLRDYTVSNANLFRALSSPLGLTIVCGSWQYATLPATDFAAVISDRPVLILSGALDPITPPRYAEAIHSTLSHSTVVSFPFEGHGVIIHSFCAQQITLAFFDAPTQPVDGQCAAADLKPRFKGADTLHFTSYNNSSITRFAVPVPVGWTISEPSDLSPLTVFTSPDKLIVSALGVYRNQSVADVQTAVSDALTAQYGTLNAYQYGTSSATKSQATVYFTTQNGQVDLGRLLLYPVGNNVAVFWLAAPAVWASATLSELQPQITAVLQAAEQ